VSGRFCPACGQAVGPPDLSLIGFLRETTRELTNWDGKVPATLRTLLVRPGRLTLDFLEGRRARWLPPLRVYLICSLAFFVSKPLIQATTGRSPRELARVTLSETRSGSLTPEERQVIAEGLPGRIFGVERLERAAAQPARLNQEIDAAFPRAMFVLLPVFALLTNLAWRRTRSEYPAHLYVALHTHAAVFAALLVATTLAALIPSDTVAGVVFVALFVYVVWYATTALHRVFDGPWPLDLAKTCLVGLVYLFCLLVTGMTLLLYAVTRI
jgi:hypothetical protein